MLLTQPVVDALLYAATAHAGQCRKGASGAPYLRHLIDVAMRLHAAGVRDEELLQAALLHDTIEDTETSWGHLAGRFGPAVADLVLEVTIPPDVKEAGGWAGADYQLAQAPSMSPRAALLKTADQLANLAELATDPPPAWDAERRAGYVAKATALVLALAVRLQLELDAAEPELDQLRRFAGGFELAPLPAEV